MIVYVALGGMVATTWVQIIKACLLLGGATVHGVAGAGRLRLLDPTALFQAAVDVHPKGLRSWRPARLRRRPGLGRLAGLGADVRHGRTAAYPDALLHRRRRQGRAQVRVLRHRLHRLLLHPDLHHRLRRHSPADERSAYYSLGADGVYNKVTDLLGGSNMAAIHLSNAVGGSLFLGFISAVAFATILAVVAGLTLAGASAVSHDLYASVIAKGRVSEDKEVRVSRIAAVVIGVVAIYPRLCLREPERRLHGGPRLCDRGELQFPGAADVGLLEGTTTRGVFIGGLLGLSAPSPGSCWARRFGSRLRVHHRPLPLRQSGAVLDGDCLRRHLAVLKIDASTERGSSGRLRAAIRPLETGIGASGAVAY